MAFLSSKNEDLSMRSMWKILVQSEKTACFQNKSANNLKTLRYILNKSGTLPEISLLKDCRNFQVCHSSIGGILTERVGPEGHQK